MALRRLGLCFSGPLDANTTGPRGRTSSSRLTVDCRDKRKPYSPTSTDVEWLHVLGTKCCLTVVRISQTVPVCQDDTGTLPGTGTGTSSQSFTRSSLTSTLDVWERAQVELHHHQRPLARLRRWFFFDFCVMSFVTLVPSVRFTRRGTWCRWRCQRPA